MKIINPGLPEPYCYECDYRKIPREYLNPRIPEGRRMVKWQAFKTIPEQYERLEQFIKDQNKIEKPDLSDDQLSDLNDKLVFKMYNDPIIKVKYFDNGYIKPLDGYIHKVDPYNKNLELYDDKGLRKIKLIDIVEIE